MRMESALLSSRLVALSLLECLLPDSSLWGQKTRLWCLCLVSMLVLCSPFPGVQRSAWAVHGTQSDRSEAFMTGLSRLRLSVKWSLEQ